MKKVILFLSILGLAFTSCESDSSSDVSGVTNYAVFQFEPLVVVPIGGTFTPNAIATEGDTEIPVTSEGDVDTNTVGVYTYTYSAVNSDGFPATATQTVVVHDPNIVGTDVSGNVRDAGNNSRTAVISLVPGTTSIFYVTDFGFAGAFPIYFQMDGDVISDIPQTYPLDQESVELGYNPGSQQFTVTIQPAGFAYTFEYY
jgi:hypothetical protein